MIKVHYSEKPEPVLVQKFRDKVGITIALNPEEVESGEGDQRTTQWVADTNDFWEMEDSINLEDVYAHPENYLYYLPAKEKRFFKDKAQAMLDALRNSTPIVPVPSYREDAAVCNRPADQIKLIAGLTMGGLPYYELASGEVVNLSVTDLQAIAVDVTAAETTWQQAKQTCWAAIDAAGTEEEAVDALKALCDVLKPFVKQDSTYNLEDII